MPQLPLPIYVKVRDLTAWVGRNDLCPPAQFSLCLQNKLGQQGPPELLGLLLSQPALLLGH